MKTISFVSSIVLLGAALTSCGLYKASYAIGLASVEAQDVENTSKVIPARNENTVLYMYEDSLLSIGWTITDEVFLFSMENKSDAAMTIDWDAMSYVDVNGNSGPLIHSGTRFVARHEGQTPTKVPKGAKISDMLVPSDNVYYGSTGTGMDWQYRPLITKKFNSQSDLDAATANYVGKSLFIYMPIEIGEETHEYTFVFRVVPTSTANSM